jgi:hypothetical protein
MLIINTNELRQKENAISDSLPKLNISKIGLVSRNYWFRFENGYRDFSYILPDVLKLLDNLGCDTVLFSLFSIIPRNSYDPLVEFEKLKKINAVLLEEFKEEDGHRKRGRYVIYHRTVAGWKEYELDQKFGTIIEMPDDFVKSEIPKRILGNCCVLLCGETNGVKYSKKDKNINDSFGLRASIPDKSSIILNPIHDRMKRFEMKRKRQFLSEKGRWVISVWNKGKKDKKGNINKESDPAWTVYFDGKLIELDRISNEFGVEIGILNIK